MFERIKENLERAMQEEYDKGFRHGEKFGIMCGKLETAKNLVIRKFPIEKIMEITNLPKYQIKEYTKDVMTSDRE